MLAAFATRVGATLLAAEAFGVRAQQVARALDPPRRVAQVVDEP